MHSLDERSQSRAHDMPRYDHYTAASINGEAAPGFSSGQALSLMGGAAAAPAQPSKAD